MKMYRKSLVLLILVVALVSAFALAAESGDRAYRYFTYRGGSSSEYAAECVHTNLNKEVFGTTVLTGSGTVKVGARGRVHTLAPVTVSYGGSALSLRQNGAVLDTITTVVENKAYAKGFFPSSSTWYEKTSSKRVVLSSGNTADYTLTMVVPSSGDWGGKYGAFIELV